MKDLDPLSMCDLAWTRNIDENGQLAMESEPEYIPN